MAVKEKSATDDIAGKSSRRRPSPPPHFFKIMLRSSVNDKRLGIPRKFVDEFGGELSDQATITVPSGRAWRVGLTKSEEDVWFDGNWQEFMEFYSIRYGSFLVFRYEGDSNFHVLIFGTGTCEINYPCLIGDNIDEQSLPLQCEEGERGKEMEIIDSVDNLGLGNQCDPRDSLVSRVNECELDGERIALERGKRAASLDQDKDKDNSNSNSSQSNTSSSKRRKMDDPVETRVPDDFTGRSLSDDGEASNAKDTSHQATPSGSQRSSSCREKGEDVDMEKNLKSASLYKMKKRKKADELDLLGKSTEELEMFGRKRFCFKSLSLRREVTDMERADAVHRARKFRSENPFFMKVLKDHHQYNAHMNVPADFSTEYMSNVSGSIKLEVASGRQWDVKCKPVSKKNRALIMRKGWNVFYRNNFLEEGDVCVFELVPRDDVVLKVAFFRVVEESGPLA